MKSFTKYYILGAFILSLCSCTKDNSMWENGGSLSLSLNMLDKTNSVNTRALSTEEENSLNSNCKIRIYSGDALVKKYQGVENIPSQILLASGDYRIRVTSGDSVAAAFDKRFFEGVEDFNIAKGAETNLDVTCTIKNTVLGILWDSSLNDIFDDYQVTATSSTGELVFTSENTNVGYFSLPQENNTIRLLFKGTKLSGEIFTEENEIIGNPSTLYNVTYKFKSTPSDVGGGIINIEVDESALGESSSSIVFKQRPVISLVDKNEEKISLDKAHTVQVGTQDPFSITVATSSSLESFVITNSDFEKWGIQNELDMTALNDTEIEDLKSKGIELIKNTPAISAEGAFWTVNFNTPIMTKITEAECESVTNISVIDENEKSRSVVWNLVVSNSTVITSQANDYDIWTRKAKLLAEVASEPLNAVKFRYRVKSTGEWTTVDAVKGESSYYADITGLIPATTYEYQVMDGETLSNVVCEITTDAEFQPENSSFEYTSGSSPILIYGDGQSMWWDTGNHGSSTMSKNVTTTDANIKHSGNQSILLKSQFVGVGIFGKFAAGNLFAGKYLKTDGTDGVLGWGRPCTSRPTAMRLWVKYLPSSTGKNDSGGYLGDMDKGTIYVAVGDWTGQEAEGETWPIVVKTKEPSSLFSTDKGTYSGKGIIGYGSKVFEENYEDNGNLKELVIPIDYQNYGGYQKKPTSIIIVASASLYGDYFCGFEGSSMWIDDIELVYE